MRFFAVSLFVLLSSAILGGSSATPAHEDQRLGGLDLGGLVANVGNTVGNVVGGVLGGVDGVVATLSDTVRKVLGQLKPVAESVASLVKEILEETGGLVCSVVDAVDGVLQFVAQTADGLITITINIETLEVCVGDEVIGTLQDDGSIVDSDGNIIGMCDPVNGLLVIVGETVKEVVKNVVGGVDSLLHSAGKLVGGLLEAVQKAIANISPAIKAVLDDLHSASAEVVQSVRQLLQETEEVLVCTVENLKNNILTFKEANGECLVSVNLGTLKVTVGGRTIGTYNNENGAIEDLHGNIIGCLDSETGILALAGDVVGNLVCAVGGLLDGLLGTLLG